MKRVRTYVRKDLVEKVFEKLQSDAVDLRMVDKVVSSTLTAVREILLKSEAGSRIEIRNFGVFEVKQTHPQTRARNPKTGATISVPSRRKVHFKPGKILQDELKKPIE